MKIGRSTGDERIVSTSNGEKLRVPHVGRSQKPSRRQSRAPRRQQSQAPRRRQSQAPQRQSRAPRRQSRAPRRQSQAPQRQSQAPRRRGRLQDTERTQFPTAEFPQPSSSRRTSSAP